VLRRNPSFRSIWLGAIVSLTGDWFTTVALFSMLLEFTGKAEAVGLALVARCFPFVLFGPAAGLFADRFHRRRVMIACDLMRAVVVLGFLFVRSKEDVPIVYALTFVHCSISAFFEPAEQASIGSVVPSKDIVTANALHAISWSAVLAFGAFIGGLVTTVVGREAAFVIDSLTFIGSAILISRARIPATPRSNRATTAVGMLGFDEIARGIRCTVGDPRLLRVLSAKAGWGLAGGGLILLYSVFAERVFPIGETAAAGIGVLYGARGFGALFGPLLARQLHGDDEAWLQRAIGISFGTSVAAFILFGLSPALWLAALALFIAHMGISTIWVFSTSLINLWVPNEMRGRIFAADGALFTIALCASSILTGHALDAWGVHPRSLVLTLAVLLLMPAVVWHATRERGTVALERIE
jgi:MFS family permease